MRITGRQLRQIIKEEVSRMMNEAEGDDLVQAVTVIMDSLKSEAGPAARPDPRGVVNDLKNIIAGSGNPRVMQTVKSMIASTPRDAVLGVKFVAKMAGYDGEVADQLPGIGVRSGITYNGDVLTGGDSFFGRPGTGVEDAGRVVGTALKNAVG